MGNNGRIGTTTTGKQMHMCGDIRKETQAMSANHNRIKKSNRGIVRRLTSLTVMVLAVTSITPVAEALDIYNGFGNLKPSEDLTIDLTVNGDTDLVNIVLTGPDTNYFAVGFGNTVMNGTYGIIVDSLTGVLEQKLGNHSAGIQLTDEVNVMSNTTNSGVRTVHLERARAIGDADYYTFAAAAGTIDLIWTTSEDAWPAFHGSNNFGIDAITLSLVPEPITLGVLAMGCVTGLLRRRR